MPGSSQSSNNNIVPTKQINMSVGDCSSTRSKSRAHHQQHSISHQSSSVSSGGQANQLDIKRQNSQVTRDYSKPRMGEAATAVSSNQSGSNGSQTGEQTTRSKRIQQITANLVLPYVTAQSWTIYDLNAKKFLQGKKENYKREIASLTKMMAFYTCLKLMEKYNIDVQTVVTASRTASLTNGTSACLREGDQLTLEQLFYGLMLPSGNDAAYCLAEFFGQYLRENKYQDQTVSSFQFNWSIVRFFLKEMNLYAFKLRMF